MPTPLLDARAKFAADLMVSNGERTATSYSWGMGKFADWLGLFGPDKAWEDITPEDFLAFAGWLAQTGLAPSSARLAAKGVAAFYRWGTAHSLCAERNLEPLMLPSPRPGPRTPTMSTRRYLEAVAGLADPTRCICTLIPLTRVPHSGLCAAPVGGVIEDEHGFAIHIRPRGSMLVAAELIAAPMDRLSRVPLEQPAVDELRRYVAAWRQVEEDRRSSPWLFPSPLDPRRPVSTDVVAAAIRQIRAATNTQRLTSTQIRHSRR